MATTNGRSELEKRIILCAATGCRKLPRRNGYCNTHSSRVRRHGDAETVKSNAKVIVVKTPSTRCWLWTGVCNNDGYGEVRIGHKMELLHRVILAAKLDKPIYALDCALHACDNPPCVNPEHLFEGSQLDNIRDCHEKGRYVKRGQKL